MSVARIMSAAALLAMVVGVAGLEELAAPVVDGEWLAPLAAAAGLVLGRLHRGAIVALAAPGAAVPRARARALAVSASFSTDLVVSRIPEPWLGGRGPPAHAG